MEFAFLHWKKNQCLEFWLKVFIQLQNNTKKNQQERAPALFLDQPWILESDALW